METEDNNKIFKELFGKLTTGSRSEIKESKKQLEKLWHMDSGPFKKADSFIFEIIKDVDSIKDGEHKAAVIAGMNLFILALMDKRFDEFSQFILKNILDSDGRVREATRNISSWLRIKYTDASEVFDLNGKKKPNEDKKIKAEEDIKVYDKFLDEIENLMKKYAPAEKPFYIGDCASSVYKSLVLLWHDMSLSTSRDFEHCEPVIDIMSDEYIPRLGNDDDEEEVDPDEIEGNIWVGKNDGDPQAGAKWLKPLEVMTRKRFEYELARLKFSQEEIGNIIATVRVYGQDGGTNILGDLLAKGKARGSITHLSEANNLVREMQAFANHSITENANGLVSHLLVEALVERECSGSGKPDNLADFIKLICQSHEAIDIFFEQHEKEDEKSFLSMLGFNKKFSKSAEEEKKHALKLEEKEKEDKLERYFGRSVAHHTLDWYIQADPGSFNRISDPRKAASYILIMVKKHNAELTDGEVMLSYDKKELSKFGGWKGAESFSMVDYKIVRPVLEMVGDPDLLLINQDKARTIKIGQSLLYGLKNEIQDFTPAADDILPIPMEIILKRRMEIERELTNMLKETGSSFSLQDVRDAIFYEKESDGMTKAVAMFDTVQGAVEFEDALELINDAWNYFPHKILDGMSPMEKLLESQKSKR